MATGRGKSAGPRRKEPAAVIGGQEADTFLGTQGDVRDTQSDMLFVFIGAGVAMLVLPRGHDRSMARVKE